VPRRFSRFFENRVRSRTAWLRRGRENGQVSFADGVIVVVAIMAEEGGSDGSRQLGGAIGGNSQFRSCFSPELVNWRQFLENWRVEGIRTEIERARCAFFCLVCINITGVT
jgi:hypothetical protein